MLARCHQLFIARNKIEVVHHGDMDGYLFFFFVAVYTNDLFQNNSDIGWLLSLLIMDNVREEESKNSGDFVQLSSVMIPQFSL